MSDLVGMGAEEAIVTTGIGLRRAGRRRHTPSTLFEATIEPLATVASVGSGDAFLAGFVTARRAERPIEDCLAYGVACGAESTQHLGAGIAGRAPRSGKLVGRVSVNRLNAPLRAA